MNFKIFEEYLVILERTQIDEQKDRLSDKSNA